MPRTKAPDASDDAPAKEYIDILLMELEQKLPHWLSPVYRLPDKRRQEIRDKHRARHLEAQKKKQRKKQWLKARARAERILTTSMSEIGKAVEWRSLRAVARALLGRKA